MQDYLEKVAFYEDEIISDILCDRAEYAEKLSCEYEDEMPKQADVANVLGRYAPGTGAALREKVTDSFQKTKGLSIKNNPFVMASYQKAKGHKIFNKNFAQQN